MPAKKLVIVESPTKARTIRRFLDSSFVIESCMGHVRDLPESSRDIPEKLKKNKWAKLGVDVEHDFQPIYVVPPTKTKVIKNLKEKLEEAELLYLATDEDREGESISWHLKEVLQPKIPVHRMVFHEITASAIKKSLSQTRSIDMNLVKAQEARRILDRLVGYTLSPLLWKKIAYGLSAGRVQSVAVRLIVEREWDRMRFQKTEYWNIKANFIEKGVKFSARLHSWRDLKLPQSSDFDHVTGKLKTPPEKLKFLNEEEAKKIIDTLQNQLGHVESVQSKPYHRKPQPPFITSTLQQEASRKLGLSARETMRVAQRLYEQGFITYMRTDSTFLSQEAIEAARNSVEKLFGKEFLPMEPRYYESKKIKGAQEAHESIRPAGEIWKLPQETGLKGIDLSLYELIWLRALACQMKDAELEQTQISIRLGDGLFQASGSVVTFAGFLKVYQESTDEEKEEDGVTLPKLELKQLVKPEKLEATRHETRPPSRFTEASLVQTLEKEGIGRPSTYATILSTIMDRGYVKKVGQALIPRLSGFLVTEYLKKRLGLFVDIHFTSKMEESLDLVAEGHLDPIHYLKDFYYDPNHGLLPLVTVQEKNLSEEGVRSIQFPHLLGFEFRLGRYGPYVVDIRDPKAARNVTIPDDLEVADITVEKLEELFAAKEKGLDSLGKDPKTGLPVYLLRGRYGYFVQLGEGVEGGEKPKRVSVPSQVPIDQITLKEALFLLELPKELGLHPKTQKPITLHIGRFGPYLEHNGESRSLGSGDSLFDIGVAKAVEILSQEKKGRGRYKKTPLKVLGEHPMGGEVSVFLGPYGPYVNWKKVNASIPKEEKPEQITLEKAIQLIQQREGLKESS